MMISEVLILVLACFSLLKPVVFSALACSNLCLVHNVDFFLRVGS